MKLAKFVHLFAVGLVLSSVAVGCRKGLDKTTQIPGQNSGRFGSERPSGIREPGAGDTFAPINRGNDGTVTGTPTGITGPGIPQTAMNPEDMIPNAEVFKNQTVYFDLDKSNVKASEISKLEEVVRRMKSEFAGQGKALRIEGHCDERGTEEYNRALGDRRALSVREKLIELGLDVQIATITFGEEKPVDTGHDNAAWAKNRRGEIVLLSPP